MQGFFYSATILFYCGETGPSWLSFPHLHNRPWCASVLGPRIREFSAASSMGFPRAGLEGLSPVLYPSPHHSGDGCDASQTLLAKLNMEHMNTEG